MSYKDIKQALELSVWLVDSIFNRLMSLVYKILTCFLTIEQSMWDNKEELSTSSISWTKKRPRANFHIKLGVFFDTICTCLAIYSRLNLH